MHIKDKKILLAVTGSIAAYKSILLVRLLKKHGAVVKVIVTPDAKKFVSPLVLATLSREKVLDDLDDGNTWANHVLLGRWADVMIIAPLTCNTLAKMANGICDNLLMAVYLSATCVVVAVPAMDEDMWAHPATQKNIAHIQSYGNKVITVSNGELASGLFGYGRMAEPEEILQYLENHFFSDKPLHGKRAMVTAGPTYEPIDPVRFIGNHSSGKMGIAIAECLYEQGANVTLILGPSMAKPSVNIKTIDIQTAQEMYTASMEVFPTVDIAVMAAAVADYRPAMVSNSKIKKTENTMVIELTKTPDILKSCGAIKQGHQLLGGFALETNDEERHAKEKLLNKNADFIVLNAISDKHTVFKSDFNKISIFGSNGGIQKYDLVTKKDAAASIVQYIINKFNKTEV